jgi:ribosomal protein S18 acetylase RimI-like enzyme
MTKYSLSIYVYVVILYSKNIYRMTEHFVGFDYNKALQTFFRQHPEIKDQFKENVTSCFLADSYLTLPKSFKRKTSFAVYCNNIFNNYYGVIQTQKEKQYLIQNEYSYYTRVFGYVDKHLLFSCTLEVTPTFVEIHDVCVGKQHAGKGYCKKYIKHVVDHIKTMYISHKKIKIMCVASNTPACKCYTSIFGQPTQSHLQDGTTINLFEMSIAH